VTWAGDQVWMLRGWIEHAYLDGLTDDELHWEPAPGMWGVRLKSEARTDRTPDQQPPGDYWADTFRDAEDPPPTTIAWRLAHLTFVVLGWSATIRGVEEPPDPAIRYDAAGALDLWRSVFDEFFEMVQSFDETELAEQVDAWDGRVARSYLISHVCLEVAYHAAEIGTLRHLKRALAS
jgi:hypothetical protein